MHDPQSTAVAFWLAISLFVFAEHTIDGGKRNVGGVDSADLFTCVFLVLRYSAQDSPFISFGEDLRPAGSCEILNSAALVISVQKFLKC